LKILVVGRGRLFQAVLTAFSERLFVKNVILLGVVTHPEEIPCLPLETHSWIQTLQGLEDPRIASHIVHVLKPDLILVASWGEILSVKTLEFLAPIKVWNLHPSLLPAHRGINPYIACILSGETQIGLSLHHLTATLDEGPILAQERITIDPEMSAGDLQSKVLKRVAPFLRDVQDRIQAQGLEAFHHSACEQSFWGASHHRQRLIEQVCLNWSSSREVLARQILAGQGWTPPQLPLSKGFWLEPKNVQACPALSDSKYTVNWFHSSSKGHLFVTVQALYWRNYRVPLGRFYILCLIHFLRLKPL
jgi:methionyl-tRNA formyltransferase